MKLFGTSGIRGPAEDLFTNQFCLKLGYVFGEWLRSQKKVGFVAVALDPRESSPRIKERITLGLAGAGWPVLDQGVIPTPALTYFVKNTPAVSGGIMITGSHITASLNGVKLFVDGEEVTRDHESQIEKLFASISPSSVIERASANVTFQDVGREMYFDMLKALAHTPYPRWKVVVDTANGAQTQIMPRLLSELGIDVVCTGDCDIQSPVFAGRDTEKPSDYAQLMAQTPAERADFGVGFDVDGDRVVFVDNRGRYIPGDYTCSLIAKYSDSPTLVTPVSTSSVVDHLGRKVYRTAVGSTVVAAKMKEVGSMFGFEANGGAISPEIMYGRDGGSTLIKVLNTLKKLEMSLSDALATLPTLTILRDKVDCPTIFYARIYSAATERYAGRDIDTTDGVKIFLRPDEWLLFRGSGNAPEFRVFAESADPKRAQKMLTDGLDLVKSVIHPRRSVIFESSPIDSLHLFESILALPDQCQQVITEMSQSDVPSACFLAKNIVISGMGGSALGGRIISHLERQVLKIPIVVSTEYHLPSFADEKTMVVISSYSGNTEESLTSLAEARARGCQIFVISAGGKLAEIAANFDLPNYIFTPRYNPSGQPRMGLGYSILTIISLLARCQHIHAQPGLGQLPSFLRTRQKEFPLIDPVVEKFVGKIPVLIASEHLVGAAHAMKNQINENAKTFCALFDLPEADHHLIEGLNYPDNSQALAFLFLLSSRYHPEVSRRYPLTSQIVRKHHITTEDFFVSGNSTLQEVMDLVQSGAYFAYRLSQLNGVDPGPIPWVDWMKDQL